MPQCPAVMTSGAVDMPTASAPKMRAMRISAGVSYCGPGKYIYTPVFRSMSRARACCLASAWSLGV